MFLDAGSNEHLRVNGQSDAVPEPGEDNGGGLTEAVRDIDELRLAGPVPVARQPPLVVVGRVARCRLEELLESHHLPPALTQGAGSKSLHAL